MLYNIFVSFSVSFHSQQHSLGVRRIRSHSLWSSDDPLRGKSSIEARPIFPHSHNVLSSSAMLGSGKSESLRSISTSIRNGITLASAPSSTNLYSSGSVLTTASSINARPARYPEWPRLDGKVILLRGYSLDRLYSARRTRDCRDKLRATDASFPLSFPQSPMRCDT